MISKMRRKKQASDERLLCKKASNNANKKANSNTQAKTTVKGFKASGLYVTHNENFYQVYAMEPSSQLKGADEESERPSKKPKKRSENPKGKKRPLQGLSEGDAGRCEACGMTCYALTKCYYAFPEKAYDAFTPVLAIIKQAQQRMSENKDRQAG
ncbi:hypothetical protein FDENT_8052 [Fusarium denticulatum]|uniref:Uncharacterized protein n=1 Tax=Fusarium denticulatum TaxID=48507 RepID=A0A8H5X404_9HYPO|nr:hypothetical protein FDENT_8052 [Fusarium denticulatum]